MIIDENQKIDNDRQPSNNHFQDSEVVLSVQGISKKFCRDLKRSLFYGVQDIASDLTGLRTKSDKLRKKEFWALDNVSFELRRGEALGLVGKNGSGKSTLLRIIAGLIKPDCGSVEITGRVAPLIALGAGFNPILTGRENIYANMAILGLSKQEIDERFDAVVEFAEIGDALDAPVQTYSSGMAARLGFACAIFTEPDILLIDEVLAVGDLKFRLKCYRQLAKLREKGTSFIFVSHSPQSILSICESAIYLSKGKLIASGEASIIINQYEEDLFIKSSGAPGGVMIRPQKSESQSAGLDITYICCRDRNGNQIEFPLTGEPFQFCIGCHAHKKISNISIFMGVGDTSMENERVLSLRSDEDSEPMSILSGDVEIRLEMPYCGFKPGLYSVKLNVGDGYLNIFDTVESYPLTVKSDKTMSQCLFYQPRKWSMSILETKPKLV